MKTRAGIKVVSGSLDMFLDKYYFMDSDEIRFVFSGSTTRFIERVDKNNIRFGFFIMINFK
jgi:tRNA(His) 5'-end guanylyltransferase